MSPRLSSTLSTLLLLALLPLGHGMAEEQKTLEQAVEEREKETAKALRAHASWCQKKKLYGKRDETLERLLEFAPDDAAARKRLRYKRDEMGAWGQAEQYKRPRNQTRSGIQRADDGLKKILEDHLSAITRLYVTPTTISEINKARRCLAALQRRYPHRTGFDDALRTLSLRYYAAVSDRAVVSEVQATAAWLLQHHGQDAEVRSALGLREHKGDLLLEETVRALSGASGLAAALQTARATDARRSQALPREEAVSLPWVAPVATTHVRAAGSASHAHLKAIAEACEASAILFRKALDTAPLWRRDLTVYVFAGEGERGSFVDAFPVVDNPTLALRDKLDLIYADGSTLLLRAILPAAQLDLAVNEVLNQLLSDALLASNAPRAWHAEGVSRYLAWKVTGTRYAINVSGKYDAGSKDRAIPDTRADWLLAARAHLLKAPADLQLLLGKGTDVFTVRDALIAFAFAMYLIEGHAQIAGRFIELHEETKDVDRTCRGLLGRRRAVVEQRLLQWIEEMIAHRPPKPGPLPTPGK